MKLIIKIKREAGQDHTIIHKVRITNRINLLVTLSKPQSHPNLLSTKARRTRTLWVCGASERLFERMAT
jgi:hypothetical protein